MKATREKMLVWVGLGTVLAAAGAGILGAAGCSSSSGGGPGPTDGSMQETSTTTDASNDVHASDAGDGSTEAGPTPLPPKVFVVHASPDEPPVRLCFGLGTPTTSGFAIATFPPLPDTQAGPQPFPGVFPGTGGLLTAPDGVDISNVTLTVYAVNAAAVATDTADGGPEGGAELTCDQLIPVAGSPDAGTYLPSQAYLPLGVVPKGALADGKSYVVAITGCAPGEPADGGVAPLCGSNYSPANGNLALTTFPLDVTTAVDGGAMGVQFAQASTAWDYAASTVGGATYAVFLEPDASPLLVTSPVSPPAFGQIQPSSLRLVNGVTFDGTTQYAASIVVFDAGAPVPVYVAGGPLPVIEQLTYGGNGVPFQNGKGFVFVLVGNPLTIPGVNPADGGPEALDAGGRFNFEYAHVLAFPTSNP